MIRTCPKKERKKETRIYSSIEFLFNVGRNVEG
jgi:hypothetical protein